MDGYTADLFVIERPADWAPESWRDTPPAIRSLWREHSGIPLEEALAIQFGFNAAAMKEGGSIWACILISWS